MKNVVKKSAFGFSAVHAGQRNVSVEPQLIATSTKGAFRLTAPVTKLLGIAPGDYVMFINNIANIDEAIAKQTPDVVAFAEENGLELGSPELTIAMHKEFDMWAVAKGIQLYSPKGTPLTCKERLSLKDKVAVVRANFDEVLSSALASDNAELVEVLSREGITTEEQVEILASTIEGQDVAKYQGAKTANPSGMTGTGLSLNFTDSNVWNQLKVGMDDAEKMNRVFDVDLESVTTILVDNGYEEVKVAIVPLVDYTDKAPVVRGADADAETEE